MFFSIPSSSDEIITVTPIGAKAILSVFFENKNGRIFNYGGQLDTVSISIDGKQIARQLPVAPFCTSTPFGAGRFDWEKVALAVNLNVDNSEVKISGIFNNEFNIVFVCSDQSVDETGFDYVETKRFVLKDAITTADVQKKILAALAADFDGIKAACVAAASNDDVVIPIFDYADGGSYERRTFGVTKGDAYNVGTNNSFLHIDAYSTYNDWVSTEQIGDTTSERYILLSELSTRIAGTKRNPVDVRKMILDALADDFSGIKAACEAAATDDVVVIPIFEDYVADATFERRTCGVTKGDATQSGDNLLNIDGGAGSYAAWYTNEHLDDATSGRSILLKALSTRIANVSKLNPAADMFGKPHNIVLDSAPERVVAYSFITPITDDVNVPIELNRINLQADLNISDSEDLPLGFDLGLISILPRVPFADAVHSYSNKQATNKYGQLTLRIAGNQRILDASNDQSVGDWQLYMMFIYKKLA